MNDLWEATFVKALPRGSTVLTSVRWLRLGGAEPSFDTDSEDSDSDSDLDTGGGGNLSTGLWPHARQGHSATNLDVGVVIFGGSYPGRTFNDTWVFNTHRRRFVSVHPVGAVPPARAGHAAVAVGRSRLLLFGGNTLEQTLAPLVWCLDTPGLDSSGDFSWSEVRVSGSSPSPRIGHSAIALGGGTKVVSDTL